MAVMKPVWSCERKVAALINTFKDMSVKCIYRPSDHHLSAKLVPAFADRECHVVSTTDLHGRIFGFLDRSCYYFFQAASQLYSQG
jgi:hypothetical protein